MAKFNPLVLPEKNMGKVISEFWKASTLINSYEDARLFFKDLLTIQETAMLARRLQIAKMIEEGFSYDVIMLVLKVGRNTVGKVARWLNYGHGGLRQVVQNMLEIEKKQAKKKQQKWDPYSIVSIKKRYASYYWPEKATSYLENHLREYLRQHRKKQSILIE